jgi:flagellar hook capping protein FlgD
MPLRRLHGSLLAGLITTLVLIVAAAPASAAVQQPTGGPILVVTSSSDHFSSYDAEILRNEGFNDFAVVDVSGMAAQLAGHDTVVLAQSALTDAQVLALTNWVQDGGNLIAMRPDKKLAPLLGLTDADDTVSNGNLVIDTTQAPGSGLTSGLLQFHGAADLYTLNGARSVATVSPGANPAVSLRNVGAGHAAAFTYDLARSVVYTRQGNPSWAGQNRDKFAFLPNPDPVIRSNDNFFGGEPGDIQPDWVDLNRVAIPQADEQQRLLANMIVQFSVTPTPRFWYLPRGDKAAIALTGDDHGGGGTSSVFDNLYNLGSDACKELPTSQAVLDTWTCPRGTSYFWPDGQETPPISSQEAENWTKYGFEFADHPMIDQDRGCVDYTTSSLNASLDTELGIFRTKYPTLPGQTTVRTHCIVWSDWASQPKADLARGIRLNTDYYYFQAEWTQNRPGLFTGSGMPMRFADCDGSLIDVYQAATYVADDATKPRGEADNANVKVPEMTKALIDKALGTEGYYGAFTIQVHTDEWSHAPARDALVAYARSKGVPIISEAQLLRWIDGRNASSFQNISYGTDGKLSFTVNQASSADGLQAMIPAQGLGTVTRNGNPVVYDTRTIKGIQYAILPDASGDYVAKYATGPAAAHVASSFTGSLPSGTGGSGNCEDAGDPGTNPGGGNPGGNPGGGNPGGGSTGDGSTGDDSTGTGTTNETGQVDAASNETTKPTPFATASASRFRPGAKRSFVLTVKLRKTSRLVVTFRGKDGKLVRTIRVPKHKAGTTVRVRWDGKDRRGHYVSAGTYRYALTAIGNRYLKTARGSVAVLRAG